MKKLLFSLIVLMLPTLAYAQNNPRNPCYYLTPNSSNCQPVSPTTPLPVTSTGGSSPSDPSYVAPATGASFASASQYPLNATPISGNATGTTGAVVGTLANVAAKTTYICGFSVSAIGGTDPVGAITIAGLVGASQVYQLASSVSGTTLTQGFSPCIPASAVNTPITVTTTANGTVTAVSVNSWGYQQ